MTNGDLSKKNSPTPTELCIDFLNGTLQQCISTYLQYGLGEFIAVRFFDAFDEISERLVQTVAHEDVSL